MSDQEFDLLDELYFIQSYEGLRGALGWEDARVAEVLKSTYDKGWIRCYDDPGHEVTAREVDLLKHYARYHYLASKAGLLAHQDDDQ